MKKVRAFPKPIQRDRKQNAGQSKTLIFCDKSTGVAHFRAQSNADLNGTVERLAGLLAMQCLVRGSDPADFAILVPAAENLTNRLVSRATELLEEGRAVTSSTPLSPRQREILQSVVCNRANKEIASRLNITVRTVKFHVSALLSKFGVRNRAELARRADGFLRLPVIEREGVDLSRRADDYDLREFGVQPSHRPLELSNKTREVRFPERFRTA
ncbi:MAG TPA: LuxR C-terminal-related transcriptional regulator [Candidatus Acidoferrales bacterium]|nr:LuxR C-terminal-related transcriptional regulator [Candidatus Acidoferrales bacterium]